MPTYKDEAIVLRTHKLGESDRIVTMLSRSHGKVRGVARGVRRTSSKFGGRLEPFSHIDVQLYEGRNLDVVTQCVSLHAYGAPLANNYQGFTAGQVMLEAAEKLVPIEKEPALRQYRLLLGAIRVLDQGTSDGPRPATLILDSYLLRAFSIAGYAPSLKQCARCGQLDTQFWFSPQAGGALCPGCRVPGAARPSMQAWLLLQALSCGDWPATKDVEVPVQREVSGLVSAFVNWHLENRLKSLPLVDRQQSEQVPYISIT